MFEESNTGSEEGGSASLAGRAIAAFDERLPKVDSLLEKCEAINTRMEQIVQNSTCLRGPMMQIDLAFRMRKMTRGQEADPLTTRTGAFPQVGVSYSGIAKGPTAGTLRPALLVRNIAVGMPVGRLEPWSLAASQIVALVSRSEADGLAFDDISKL